MSICWFQKGRMSILWSQQGMGGRDDGDSPVVWHAALNHKVVGSNPTPRGRGINHKSIISHHRSSEIIINLLLLAAHKGDIGQPTKET